MLLSWFAAGWHRVGPDRYVIRISFWRTGDAVPLSPGWHWTGPGLSAVRSYPRGVVAHRFRIGAGENRLASGSGEAIALEGTLRYRMDESGLAAAVRSGAAGGGGEWLDACLRDAVRQLLAVGTPPAAGADGESRLARQVASRLAAGGFSLVSLHLSAVGSPADVAVSRHTGSARARVLVVGWDGADWNVIDPLLAAGDMPNLAGLVAAGTRARLMTVTPALSPVVWTSVATGTRPAKHGIIDFLAVDRTTGESVPVTSNLRREPALWTLLTARNIPSGVVGWWATWPAEAVTGYMVTDRLAYQLFGMGKDRQTPPTGLTWPPDLFDEIAPLVEKPADVPDAAVRAFADLPDDPGTLRDADRQLLDEFRTVLATTETYDAVAQALAHRSDPVLRCVYYEATDTAAHLFMPYRPPRMTGADEVSGRIWARTVDEVYRDLDRRLGRLLQTVDEQTTVVVLSDHGFRSGQNRPAAESRIGSGTAADWHRKYGILVMAGRSIEHGGHLAEASVVDVAPTILALLGLPVPAAMDGQVLRGALTPMFLAQHPVQTGPPVQEARAAGTPIRSTADDAIVRRLTSLGYLGSSDADGLVQDAVTANNNRATVLLADGDAAGAIAELRRGLTRAPDAIPLRLNLARALRLEGNDVEAEAVLTGLIREHPDLATAHNLLGNLYLDQGDLHRAGMHFSRCLEIDPNFIGGEISLGLLAERQDDLDTALEHYRRAATIDPDAAEPFNNVGNVLRARALAARTRGDAAGAKRFFAGAVASYRQAIDADPTFIGSYNNLALVYQDTGRPDEAMSLYREGLDRAPDNPTVRNNLGSLYFAAGRLDDARREFQRAIDLDPDYASAHNNLGAVLGRQGRPAEEIAAYRRAVAIEPDYADAHHNLGLALIRAGEEGAGEAALKKALEINPGYLSAYVALGNLYLARDDFHQAEEMFSACLLRNPGLFAVRNRLADTYVEAGQTEKGIAEYRRSLHDQPGQPEIEARLEALGA
ncbi:MAG: tetratricopeptide repeat protein [Acidobacteriota bacterium]